MSGNFDALRLGTSIEDCGLFAEANEDDPTWFPPPATIVDEDVENSVDTSEFSRPKQLELVPYFGTRIGGRARKPKANERIKSQYELTGAFDFVVMIRIDTDVVASQIESEFAVLNRLQIMMGLQIRIAP